MQTHAQHFVVTIGISSWSFNGHKLFKQKYGHDDGCWVGVKGPSLLNTAMSNNILNVIFVLYESNLTDARLALAEVAHLKPGGMLLMGLCCESFSRMLSAQSGSNVILLTLNEHVFLTFGVQINH